MKAMTAIAVAIGVALAVAANSNAFAADPPGSTPSKPNRLTAVPPPPPPPGGPDKYTTQTRPPGPDGRQHARPKPIDDFAPDPNTQPSTCHAVDITFGNCAASLLAVCIENKGEFSCGDDWCHCENPPQN